MGLTYFMLQSLRNVRFKGEKEVCCSCDANDLLKEKYLVLFMESWEMFCCCSSELFVLLPEDSGLNQGLILLCTHNERQCLCTREHPF